MSKAEIFAELEKLSPVELEEIRLKLATLAERSAPKTFKGRPIVRSYDPRKWPYPPEPDCQEEWNESRK